MILDNQPVVTKPEGNNFVNKEKSRIFIYGEFDISIMKNVVPDFMEMIATRKAQATPAPLEIHIASDGGYAYVLRNMLSLVEQAKKSNIAVKTFVLSHAYSCGSMLACSGTPGERYISEFAEHLPHLGSASTGIVINDIELERSSARIKEHFNYVRKIYKKYADIKDLEKVIHDDNYFIRGKEIIKNGLADKVID